MNGETVRLGAQANVAAFSGRLDHDEAAAAVCTASVADVRLGAGRIAASDRLDRRRALDRERDEVAGVRVDEPVPVEDLDGDEDEVAQPARDTVDKVVAKTPWQ